MTAALVVVLGAVAWAARWVEAWATWAADRVDDRPPLLDPEAEWLLSLPDDDNVIPFYRRRVRA